jgi:prevent-host-death family protein
MKSMPEIVPITELRRDTAAVLWRLQTSDEPVVVTKWGGAVAVILSIDAYETGERERLILHRLLRGEQEIASGVGHDLDDVLTEADLLLADGSA